MPQFVQKREGGELLALQGTALTTEGFSQALQRVQRPWLSQQHPDPANLLLC
jgi:hypothetical protein